MSGIEIVFAALAGLTVGFMALFGVLVARERLRDSRRFRSRQRRGTE